MNNSDVISVVSLCREKSKTPLLPRLQANINKLDEIVVGDNRVLNLDLPAVCLSLYESAQKYFDCRTYHLISNDNGHAEKKLILKELVKHFTTEEENTSPYEYYRKHKRTLDGAALLSESDHLSFLDDDAPVAYESLSKTSKLAEEMREYEKLMQSIKGTTTDPLLFWTQYSCKFPILSTIARIVLSIPPPSADVERFFSRSGRVVSDARSSLTSDHVNELSTLYFWLLEKEDRLHSMQDPSAPLYASVKAAEHYLKFVTLTIDLELHEPTQLVEFDDEEGSDDEDE